MEIRFTAPLCWVVLVLSACGGGNDAPSMDTTPSSPNNNDTPTFEATTDFQSTEEFISNLQGLSQIEDETERNNALDSYWQTLQTEGRIPYTNSDGTVFLYRGNDVRQLQVQGDWSWFVGSNAWPANATSPALGAQISGTDLWVAQQALPSDARVDYKLVVNAQAILDPSNPAMQMSGFGTNSELAMPDYVGSIYSEERTSDIRGELSATQSLSSTALGVEVNYRVYTPYNYALYSDMPVIYFTDGHEYSDNAMGAVVINLDNLIADQLIEPVIAVFIDPRHPTSGVNQRANQYWFSPAPTAQFIAEELVPEIDANFASSSLSQNRIIWGTSLGGMFSSYVCFHETAVFGKCGIHSPAFAHPETINLIENTRPIFPQRIALSTGNVGDFVQPSRDLRDILEANGYTLDYSEVSQGHSWGNWSDTLAPMLQYLLSD